MRTDYNDPREIRMSAEAFDWLQEKMPEIRNLVLAKFRPDLIGKPSLTNSIGSAILICYSFQPVEHIETTVGFFAEASAKAAERLEDNILTGHLRAFTNNTFAGYWPVGSAAVVVAPDAEEAAKLLNEKLESIHLEGKVEASDMLPLPMDVPLVCVLCDGDY
jgi:hypothetical protein